MIISDTHLDYLKEIINMGVGKGANVLNTMLESHIQLSVPDIVLKSYDEFISDLEHDRTQSISAVELQFRGNFSGISKLIFPSESALKLVNMLTEQDTDVSDSDLDAIKSGTLSEIGNIVLNSVIGVFCNYFNLTLRYSVPTYSEGPSSNLFNITEDRDKYSILIARTRFTIETLNIEGDIVLLFEIGALDSLLSRLDED